MTAFDEFRSAAAAAKPRAAVVLGSGLGTVVNRLKIAAEVAFAAVPGFAAPTVHGHGGRILVGDYAGVGVILFQGRMHYYEGHPWSRVVSPVRLAAELGATSLILTNAAGGLHPQLNPGDLMAIDGHLTLLSPNDWRQLTSGESPPGTWDREYVERLQSHGLLSGTYAALTGPCYETPAEIRALAILGADAVGMSTAKEAETGRSLGLRVAGISCITNKAAGMSDGPLDHNDVLQNATGPAERVADLIASLLRGDR